MMTFSSLVLKSTPERSVPWGGEKLFDASLALKRRLITRSSLNGLLIRYPVLTGKVIAMIYWQALRLVLKKTPFFAHPN